MSKAINRRAIMAGAAATLPAIATLPAVAGQSGPDAELITLSAQLGPLVREQEIQSQLDLKRSDQYEAAVARSTGISSDKAPDRENDPTGYWAIRGQLFEQHEAADDGHSQIIYDRLHALCEDILAKTAQTKDGFAVQVRAINSLLNCAGVQDDEAAFIERRAGFRG